MRMVLKHFALNNLNVYCRISLQPFLLTDSHYIVMLPLCSLSQTIHFFWNLCPGLNMTWGLFLHCGLLFSALFLGSHSVFQWAHVPLFAIWPHSGPECSPLCTKPKLVTLSCKTFHKLRGRVCHPSSSVLCLRTEVTPLKPFRSMHTYDWLTALMPLLALTWFLSHPCWSWPSLSKPQKCILYICPYQPFKVKFNW